VLHSAAIRSKDAEDGKGCQGWAPGGLGLGLVFKFKCQGFATKLAKEMAKRSWQSLLPDDDDNKTIIKYAYIALSRVLRRLFLPISLYLFFSLSPGHLISVSPTQLTMENCC